MRIHLFFVLFSVLSPRVGSHLFYYVPLTMSWSSAQTYCRQHYTDLATIDDQTDLLELLKAVPNDFPNDDWIWIGLYRMGYTLPWIWSDQSNSTFQSWGSGQPNYFDDIKICVATSAAGFWNDWNCKDTVTFTFFCYSDRKTQTVRVQVKSSGNVNNPAVKNEILMKIEQKLKEKGLAENATLSWRTQSDGNIFQKYRESDAAEQICSKTNE
ncbi:C-type lectin mannose-binding isoform-like [Xyrauchen texanus]|uniref:C-type lectin mannose-binding isoform-like n=1 Tax=Xyrauchen texanus TaxID=154827 RepID=UPI002241CC86|nr:C-type lectin mannose-binding isoform-like [Xyrauchen texanus]